MSEYRDIGLFTGGSGFEGAIGKIGRARFQLKDLNERFRKFTESHPYRVIEKFELSPGEDMGDYTFTIKLPRVPNREWGVLIGEIVHNLRSALEQTAYAASSKPSRDTGFPICKTKEQWDKWSSAMVFGIPKKAVTIIKQAQPYHWGEDAGLHELWLLERMWNHDKHRLLHTTRLVFGRQPQFVKVRDVAEILGTTVALEDDAEVVHVFIRRAGPNPKLKPHGKLSAGIAFAEGVERAPRLEGLHVIAVLEKALRGVAWAVGSIEAACQPASRP